MGTLMRMLFVSSVALLPALAGCNLFGGPNYFVDDDFDAASSGVGGRDASSSSTTSATASTTTTATGSSVASSGTGAACVKTDCEAKDAVDDCFYSACVNDVCDGMLIVKKNVGCGADGGKFCDGAGECVGCTGDAQCPTGTKCVANFCQGPACSDKVKNGDEVAVDCGGPESGCPACPNGTVCTQATDCSSKVCKSGACQPCTNSADCSGVANHYCSVVSGLVCIAKKGAFGLCLGNEECLSGTCNPPFCE